MSIQITSDADIYNRIRLGCKNKRLALDMSQVDLAKKAGVAVRTIKNFELGDQISLMSLMKIMRAIGESSRFEFLVPEEGPSPREQFLKSQDSSKVRRGKT
jgi:transcriptional regulator with XRE-family HTH domain